MLYTLVSMLWFVTYNYLLAKGNMSRSLIRFATQLQNIFRMCSCSKQIKPIEAKLDREETLVNPSDTVLIVKPEKSEKVQKKTKCNNCDRCDSCIEDSKNERDRMRDKREYEKKVEMINYFVLFIFTMLMIGTQLGIWLSVSI